jgi:hypothetical protein
MKHAIILALLLTASTTANAEISIAGGVDIAHDAGKPYAEIRYFGEEWRWWSAWIGTDRSIGAEVYTTIYDLEIGLGIENAKSGGEIVSTPWAYQIRFEYPINEKWGIGLKHRSNCKAVCNNDFLDWIPHGDKEDWNHGNNFLYIRHRF